MLRYLLCSLLLLAPTLSHAQEWVRLPKSDFDQVQDKIKAAQKVRQSQTSASFYLVHADYFGQQAGSYLDLKLKLKVQLTGEGQKRVPVLGTEVALKEARLNGQAVALSQRGQYWVWESGQKGVFELELSFLVATSSPKGALDYSFSVTPTPVSTLSVHFDEAGLSPRVVQAALQKVVPHNGGVVLKANLKSGNRLQILGYRDISAQLGARKAKSFAQSHHLVSISEEQIELFAVVRYNILYAPLKKFQVQLPPGYEVVSADGQGAFSYQLRKTEQGPILEGETASGIEGSYEISLRLSRPLKPQENDAQLPVVRALGCERERGFIAIEVPGRISIQVQNRPEMRQIDVRELPESLVNNSVSPLVEAYRYHRAFEAPKVTLSRFPEIAVSEESIDSLKASSVLTADGRMMTELRIRLRNHLRQYLGLRLPASSSLESAVLGNQPIKPSMNAEGWVKIPLTRSRVSGGQLRPIEIQIVYSEQVKTGWWLGLLDLNLPKLELPIASIDWQMYLPNQWKLSKVYSEVSPQKFVRSARWFQAPVDYSQTPLGIVQQAGNAPAAAAGGGGAVAVRMQSPRAGQRKHYWRYWQPKGQQVKAHIYYCERSLWGGFGFIALVALGLIGWGLGRRYSATTGIYIGLAAVISSYALELSLWWPFFLGGVLFLANYPRNLRQQVPAWLGVWRQRAGSAVAELKGLSEQASDKEAELSWWVLIWQGIGFSFRLGVFCILGIVLLTQLVSLLRHGLSF